MQNITLIKLRSYGLVIGFYLVLLYFILPQDFLFAQEVLPWTLRAEFGGSEIHHPQHDGYAFAFRVSRTLEHSGKLCAEGSIVTGSADEGFLYFDSGLEFKPFPNLLFSPFIGAGIGLLAEPEYFGEILRISAGTDINLGPRIAFRLNMQRGRHGGMSGPHLITIGLGIRFGSRK